jgi:hypothetical protein
VLSVVEESRHWVGSIVQSVTTEKIEDPFSKNISLREVFVKPRAAKFSFSDFAREKNVEKSLRSFVSFFFPHAFPLERFTE